MYRGWQHPYLPCMDAATLAGTVSTVLFAAANLPMVVKAVACAAVEVKKTAKLLEEMNERLAA